VAPPPAKSSRRQLGQDDSNRDSDAGRWRKAACGDGQQSLMPPVCGVASGFGGGQLIWAALTVLDWAAAWGQAAAGGAASATAAAAAANTTVPVSLAGARGAGRASLSRCGCLGCIIGFLPLPELRTGACRARGGLPLSQPACVPDVVIASPWRWSAAALAGV
jgi:hypothetical protein